MTAALLISVYLAIGLFFRPYTRDFSLWQGVLLHLFWLPAMIIVFIALRSKRRGGWL